MAEDEVATPKYLAQFGQLPEYHPETEKIAVYLERVELFFAANDIVEDKRVAIFLSSVGGKTYSILQDLLAPDKPSAKSLDQLFTALKTHYQPQPLVIAECFYFHRRSQAVNESIADYMAALCQLATHCVFANFLDDALRDRLVCGLRSTTIQKRLLSKRDLTLTTALHLAQSMEAAEVNVSKLQNDEPTAPINRTEAGPQSRAQQTRVCHRCGGTDHTPAACRFKEFICNKCKKKGHLARVCRSTEKTQSSTPGRSTQQSQVPRPPVPHNAHNVKQPRQTNNIREPTLEDTTMSLFKVDNNSSRPMSVTLEVNKQKLSMEVDTGAAVSVISEATKAQLFPGVRLSDTSVMLTTYTGEQMAVIGEISVTVRHGQKNHCLTLCVIKGNGPSLLGRD